MLHSADRRSCSALETFRPIHCNHRDYLRRMFFRQGNTHPCKRWWHTSFPRPETHRNPDHIRIGSYRCKSRHQDNRLHQRVPSGWLRPTPMQYPVAMTSIFAFSFLSFVLAAPFSHSQNTEHRRQHSCGRAGVPRVPSFCSERRSVVSVRSPTPSGRDYSRFAT